VLATLAFLIRQLGAALVLIPLAYLLLARVAGGERRPLPWSHLIWLLVPFLGVGLTRWWIHAVHGETRVSLEKAQMLRLIWSIDRWVYIRELLHALLHLGLVLWPLAWVLFGHLSTGALVWASAVIGGLSALCLWQAGALPHRLGIMLTWDELGLARELIAGQIAHRQLPHWGQGVLLGVSLSAAVGLVAVLWDRLRRWPQESRGPGTMLLLNLLLQMLLFEALWLYYDRYYLPLLPGLTALLPARLRPTKVVMMMGMAGVLLWGLSRSREPRHRGGCRRRNLDGNTLQAMPARPRRISRALTHSGRVKVRRISMPTIMTKCSKPLGLPVMCPPIEFVKTMYTKLPSARKVWSATSRRVWRAASVAMPCWRPPPFKVCWRVVVGRGGWWRAGHTHGRGRLLGQYARHRARGSSARGTSRSWPPWPWRTRTRRRTPQASILCRRTWAVGVATTANRQLQRAAVYHPATKCGPSLKIGCILAPLRIPIKLRLTPVRLQNHTA
jgi:hypothetical protein